MTKDEMLVKVKECWSEDVFAEAFRVIAELQEHEVPSPEREGAMSILFGAVAELLNKLNVKHFTKVESNNTTVLSFEFPQRKQVHVSTDNTLLFVKGPKSHEHVPLYLNPITQLLEGELVTQPDGSKKAKTALQTVWEEVREQVTG